MPDVARHATTRVLLALLAAAALVFGLFGAWLIPAFQSATDGRYPIDMGFPLTPAVIFAEIDRYTEASRAAYRWFFAVDLVWPPLLALVFVLGWHWLARRTAHPLPARALAAGAWALPVAQAALDLGENLAFLGLIESSPPRSLALAWTASALHNLKLPLYGLCWLVTLAFVALALARRRPA